MKFNAQVTDPKQIEKYFKRATFYESSGPPHNRVFPIFVQIAVKFVKLDEFCRIISSLSG